MRVGVGRMTRSTPRTKSRCEGRRRTRRQTSARSRNVLLLGGNGSSGHA